MVLAMKWVISRYLMILLGNDIDDDGGCGDDISGMGDGSDHEGIFMMIMVMKYDSDID